VLSFGVGAVNFLSEDMPGGASGFEILDFAESLREVADLGFLGGDAWEDVVGGGGGSDHWSVHGGLNLSKLGSAWLFRKCSWIAGLCGFQPVILRCCVD
jgi:hypothetical protein